MKTEEIMKDCNYNHKLNERNNGHLSDISDIFLKFIRTKAEAQNLSSNETLIYSKYKKPQMKAPRVTPLEGVYTYALRGIRGCGVENPQGFGIDERRYIPPESDLSKIIHLKGCKERKAMQQEFLRPLCSLRLNIFSAPAHERVPPAPAVNLRLSRAGG